MGPRHCQTEVLTISGFHFLRLILTFTLRCTTLTDTNAPILLLTVCFTTWSQSIKMCPYLAIKNRPSLTTSLLKKRKLVGFLLVGPKGSDAAKCCKCFHDLLIMVYGFPR